MKQIFQFLMALFGLLKSLSSGSPKSTVEPSSGSNTLSPKPLSGNIPPLSGNLPPIERHELSPQPIEVEKDRVGYQIIAFEAHPEDPHRRTPEGYLDIVGLPANDGGGSWEIAGINDYHPEARAKLLAMAPIAREAFAAQYIEIYARAGTGIKATTTLRQGTQLFVLDCAFNRGAGGACAIVQDALIRIGFSLDSMGGSGWGDRTRAALEIADVRHASKLINELRAARERYEDARDAKNGARPNLRGGLVNRWNNCAEIAHEWNAETAPVEVAPAPVQPYIASAPEKIILPRESNEALNRFYGTATPSGNFLEWFNFPVGNVRLYSRDGADLGDRDGDGNDEHRAHKMIVKPLEAALREIYATLGKERFELEGWHVYAGAFNYRTKTGGSSLSTHSWGIAVDFNPAPNGWKHYATTFSDQAIDIMEKHGFLSGFRAWGHDAMHFQRCIPSISSGSYYAKHGLPSNIVAA